MCGIRSKDEITNHMNFFGNGNYHVACLQVLRWSNRTGKIVMLLGGMCMMGF